MSFDAACAEACAAAYIDPATWTAGDAFAIVSQSDDLHIVAFRGSESLRDWLVDFSLRPAWHPQLGWCHEGFLADVMQIAPQMIAELAGKRVALAAHSKGAECLIFGALMLLAGHPPEAIVTFGAPRVGFGKLRDILNPIDIRQYHNGNDPVPAILPEIFGWRHAREPLIQYGPCTLDPFDSHFLASYRALLP